MVAEVNSYVVNVTRDGRFWHIDVPEIQRVTQARNVGEIDLMTRDLIAIMLDIEPDSFDIDVQIQLPADVRGHLAEVERARADEAAARARAAAELRAAAITLKNLQISVRDLGKLLGVSFQRASQLTSHAEKPPQTATTPPVAPSPREGARRFAAPSRVGTVKDYGLAAEVVSEHNRAMKKANSRIRKVKVDRTTHSASAGDNSKRVVRAGQPAQRSRLGRVGSTSKRAG